MVSVLLLVCCGPTKDCRLLGLLSSGIIPCVKHALAELATMDAVVIPASATVSVQAVQIYTEEVCGIDMSPVNRWRWSPMYTAGQP